MSEVLVVKGLDIRIINQLDEEYISLTDMLRGKDSGFFISDWLRNRNTLEYIGIWESVHNPNFNYGEFAIIKNMSGLNNFKISVKELVNRTNAISIVSKAGRYGGTYAHKDIAFEFGMWISPEFKIYLVKEYQLLKRNKYQNTEWTAKRELSKINYLIHTSTIKENLIIKNLTNRQISRIYASEADMLNIVVFNMTANEWSKENESLKGNIRDYASINQLLILANLESYNSILIKQGLKQKERILLLH